MPTTVQAPALDVTLVRATRADAALLSNLFQLYAHDLSAVFALDLGEDGRYAYDRLEEYWSSPRARFAFLIRCGRRLAGFALVTRGSPASNAPNVHDMAEFFIVRRHRRPGVGRRAASLLWDAYPGPWTVRVSAGNHAACEFWWKTIAECGRAASESSRPGDPHPWRIFSLNAAGQT